MRAPRRRGALAGLVAGILLMIVPVALWAAGTPARAAGDVGSAAARPAAAPGDPLPVVRPGSGSNAAGPADPVVPVRIRLPDLGVDAPVEPVGVDGHGEMAVPEDVRTVGWYRFGPAPGTTSGSGVLAGHVDDRVQGHGAFYRLAELAPGDPVLVGLADGTELRYRVREVERIDKARLPVERVFAREGPPRLTLITCGGPFDRAAGHFRDNVVVLATPEP